VSDRDGHWLFGRKPPVLWGSIRHVQFGSEEDRKREEQRAREWAAYLRFGLGLLRAQRILFLSPRETRDEAAYLLYSAGALS
jgi:hypothetical protein